MFEEAEALEWLSHNPNPRSFTRFRDTLEALVFVQKLYALGAVEVFVTGILCEEWRIEIEGGPFADTLVVHLPKDSRQRKDLLDLYSEEVLKHGCNEGDGAVSIVDDFVTMWWD